jgi:hypothetical protein
MVMKLSSESKASLIKLATWVMWIIVLIFFVVGISKVGELGFRRIQAIGAAQKIPSYLQHPASFKIQDIKTYVLKHNYTYTDDGKITDESEELDKLFGNRPIINYVLYSAQDKDRGYERFETFIIVNGEPMISYGNDTYTNTLKEPYEQVFRDYESLLVTLTTQIYDYENYDFESDITLSRSVDVERFDKLPGYLTRMFFAFVIGLFLQICVSILSRSSLESKQSDEFEKISKLINSAYPSSMLPKSYQTYKVNKKNCHVWIDLGDLCLMQTKASIKKKARKNIDLYDSEEKIKGNIFMRRISISKITNVSVIEEKGCIVYYAEYGETKTLNFALNAQEFVEGLQEHIGIKSVFAGAGGKAFE